MPGQRCAHDLSAVTSGTAVPSVAETRPAYTFCAYDKHYTGTGLQLVQCNIYTAMPWSVTGSWKNDRSTGTRAYFYLKNGSVHETPGAWSAAPSYNWAPVDLIEACKS